MASVQEDLEWQPAMDEVLINFHAKNEQSLLAAQSQLTMSEKQLMWNTLANKFQKTYGAQYNCTKLKARWRTLRNFVVSADRKIPVGVKPTRKEEWSYNRCKFLLKYINHKTGQSRVEHASPSCTVQYLSQDHQKQTVTEVSSVQEAEIEDGIFQENTIEEVIHEGFSCEDNIIQPDHQASEHLQQLENSNEVIEEHNYFNDAYSERQFESEKASNDPDECIINDDFNDLPNSAEPLFPRRPKVDNVQEIQPLSLDQILPSINATLDEMKNDEEALDLARAVYEVYDGLKEKKLAALHLIMKILDEFTTNPN
ncbi:hypothetical protein QAD02_007389 [Eretmocerus hayati]|uniref:Uncharacterized protein n=1 Tax=Eretmocerus hayati TaxID=131215 RepID=A0ACC2N5Y7_9HYME|nr:hypothetical protein QAD02_007389 [Eretmocerus hayati]